MKTQRTSSSQESIKIQFSKVLFWGKPDELPPIIKQMEKERLLLMEQKYLDEDKLFVLNFDIYLAKAQYDLAISLQQTQNTRLLAGFPNGFPYGICDN